MPLRDTFNQLRNKLEDFNKQHNILPFGQNSQQNQLQQYPGYPPPQQQYQNQQQYPGQQQHYYPGQQQQQQYPGYPPPQQYQPQQLNQPQQSYPGPQSNYQQQDYNRPPPVPQYSHPNQQAPQQVADRRYWQAKFDPSKPVSEQFEQKTGNNNGWGNNELENYTSNAENSFFTNDNKLILRAIANTSSPTPDQKYTSARLITHQTLSHPRGVLTGILTLPCAPGIWPAFWLLPKEPFTWPHEGEIDIAESWNASMKNHSCLHWGFYTPEDNWKHLSIGTDIPDMATRAIKFDLAWHDDGRLMWYIDGRPVMRAKMPQGARPITDWCVLLNVAMGGNVCNGQTPRDGAYDMVVHALYMSEELENGGWNRFEGDWNQTREGNTL